MVKIEDMAWGKKLGRANNLRFQTDCIPNIHHVPPSLCFRAPSRTATAPPPEEAAAAARTEAGRPEALPAAAAVAEAPTPSLARPTASRFTETAAIMGSR